MIEGLWEEIPRFFTYYNWVFLLEATGRTLVLTGIGCLVGFAFGFYLAVARLYRGRVFLPLKVIIIFYVEIFRRVPFLVTLMLIFFFCQGVQLDVSVFTVALITVCLIAAAYTAEIVRAGFESVHHTQWEATEVMNFTLARSSVWW